MQLKIILGIIKDSEYFMPCIYVMLVMKGVKAFLIIKILSSLFTTGSQFLTKTNFFLIEKVIRVSFIWWGQKRWAIFWLGLLCFKKKTGRLQHPPETVWSKLWGMVHHHNRYLRLDAGKVSFSPSSFSSFNSDLEM